MFDPVTEWLHWKEKWTSAGSAECLRPCGAPLGTHHCLPPPHAREVPAASIRSELLTTAYTTHAPPRQVDEAFEVLAGAGVTAAGTFALATEATQARLRALRGVPARALQPTPSGHHRRRGEAACQRVLLAKAVVPTL